MYAVKLDAECEVNRVHPFSNDRRYTKFHIFGWHIKPEAVGKAKKFGAFGGVFTPSILAILGVIMYLRLPWIVGHAGLWAVLGIILVAHIISVTTGLSVASVATDKRVETGGSYYIISRSLGLPIGGTLGVALFVGFSFSVSLYLLGFSETFLSAFGMEINIQNIRLTGSVILLLVTAVTFISTSLAIRVQYLIMAAIVLSLLSVFLGSHEHVPREPLMMSADDALPWIALFAIFFPAVTGFQAGVSLSGDLKDPRKNIPAGVIMAILAGLLVYTGLALFFAFTVDRDMLMHDPRVLFSISRAPELVIAGILAATLSSAMVSILSAPRILQAVAMDRILPGFFARGHGASNEPRNALLIAFLIAQTGILIGELNVIARIVTIFFIIIYGFLNITYAIESWAGSDFRPTFKIPRFVSIIGALACVVVMIQLDIVALFVASAILVALFLFLKKKELTLQTGDTWTGVWSSLVKAGLSRLSVSGKKTRNWRPNVMLFSGGEKSRPHLIEMGRSLVGKMGVFTNFELTEQPGGDILFGIKEMQMHQQGATAEQKGVFTRRHTCRDIYEGIDIISRVYGFTGFEPNTVLMGWARNTRHPEKFAKLLASLKRQDFNSVFLSYDKEKGFGSYKKIDFWWKGSGRGLSLALFLLRFITTSDRWRTARLRILVINNDSSKTDTLYSLINQLLDNNRMKADVKVINNGVEQLSDEKIIGAESRETDLTIMELPGFGVKEMGSAMAKTNTLSESVHTSLFISPSTFFDEVTVLDAKPVTADELMAEETQRPSPEILKNLSPASREIIANQVNNTGQTAAHFIQKYFEQGPDRIFKLDLNFFPDLQHFVFKTLNNLEKDVTGEKDADRSKSFLRILNDFSFHSQRQMQILREQRVASIRKILEEANLEYLDALRAMINVMPEKIRIKLTRDELAIKPHDRFKTRLYKARKMFVAFITRRPVAHRVKVLPAARYFLYHNRLTSLHQLMTDFSLHSFSEVVEIRKLFNGMHELIEKTRPGTGSKQQMVERIKLERSRLAANIEVLVNQSQHFHYQSGQKLYEGLLHDLQQFSHHLDSTGANIRSSNFSPYFKNDPALVVEIGDYPAVWAKKLGVFINKAILDFYILSLKSRIHSKIMKYHIDFRAALETGMIRQVEEYEAFAEKLLAQKPAPSVSSDLRLDHESLKPTPIPEIYQGLYAEIGELLHDIPEKIEISGEQLAEKIQETAFSEADSVVVSFRKTVEYYIGAELIDHSLKQSHEAEIKMQQVTSDIKDLVRLLNFSMDNESKNDDPDDQAYRRKQTLELVMGFAEKVKTEKNRIRKIADTVEGAFEDGLKKGFDPLSAATISRSGMAIRKRQRDTEQNDFAGQLRGQWKKVKEATQDRFVDLLYSKSEGQLWISHFEKQDVAGHHSNKDILSFVEAVTPGAGVMKELPFYYYSLFSGQSGTGEDFWVGMQDEIDECTRAIKRFKTGFPGALIITGDRSSGKSGLSRKVAGHHFSKDNIHSLRAPQGCSADVSLFSLKLTEALNAHNKRLDDVMMALPAGKAIIIQDLGLWWERRPGGDAVVELIKDMIDRFGHKCLFIINVNSHALERINRQSELNKYALAVVSCQPFDARELKEMMMLRHQAGGMKLRYKRKEEDKITAWDHARLFNDLFNLSFGNPGTANVLWLSSIKKVLGKTLTMDGFRLPDTSVFDALTPEQWFYIQQFVVNRRFSVDKLSENLETPRDKVLSVFRELMRAGILIQKFEGVYAIRPGLDLYLADQLKTKKHL